MTVNLATKYSALVDERFKLGSLTGALVNKDYDFVGVKTVQVYSIDTVAMGAYSRTGTNRYGAPTDLDDAVQELTLTQDRAFTFVIDKGDALQQMGVKNAGVALRRQIDEVAIPEMDKYVIGKLVAGAGTTSATTPITKTNAYEEFLAAQEALTENKVPTVGRIAIVTPKYFTNIKLDDAFIKNADLGQQIVLTGQLGAVDGVPIIVAPASYFPLNTDFVLTHPVATTAPVQLAEYKLHDDAPGYSGTLVEGRLIYDAFVLDQKKKAVFAHKNA